jgi:cytochrome b6-f complex iron-sulfur subunit
MTAPEPKLTRRGFITLINRVLAATGVAAVIGPVVAFFWPAKLEEVPSEPLPVGDQGSIPEGQAKTIRYGRYPAIILNTPERGLVAYSAVCTHFACIVKWNPDTGMIECPCHEGYFDPVDGSVIEGPPPEPLGEININIESGTIFIGGDA